jgi:hypothetical protein
MKKPLHMEMHVLPQQPVIRIAARLSCKWIEIGEYDWAETRTTATISNTFFVVKE